MEWAGNLPADRAADARRAVLENWLQIRPEGAAAYALKLPAGKERDAAISSISQNMFFASSALEPALDWFRKLSDADRQTARDAMNHISMDPERKRRVAEALEHT